MVSYLESFNHILFLSLFLNEKLKFDLGLEGDFLSSTKPSVFVYNKFLLSKGDYSLLNEIL